MGIANRVYIASKLGPMEEKVRDLRLQLEELGYEVIYDWTEHPVPKPFEEHVEEATEAADNMVRAVMQCDVLIVLCADRGLGMHIETGGALVASLALPFITGQSGKRIYIVGDGNNRSVFYFHNMVVRLPDISALLAELASNPPSQTS
jgi:hypothetical protein